MLAAVVFPSMSSREVFPSAVIPIIRISISGGFECRQAGIGILENSKLVNKHGYADTRPDNPLTDIGLEIIGQIGPLNC